MSDYEDLLCVGGSYDGEITNISKQADFMDIVVDDCLALDGTIIMNSEAYVAENMNIENYKRMTFRGDEKNFDVLVLDGLNANDVLEKLIDTYNLYHT